MILDFDVRVVSAMRVSLFSRMGGSRIDLTGCLVIQNVSHFPHPVNPDALLSPFSMKNGRERFPDCIL
jgi:hypothetical protein